ncbi:MAG: SIS domain-containing protein [Bryobacterales bacterium]|nr:SIS domain-containing protein [Bryobacterales bacterium]
MSLMLDEIRQQPAVLERTLRQELKAVERLKKALANRKPRYILLAARGTSDNAALFGRYLLEITTGIPVSLAAPSIFTLYGATVDCRDALVVAISQSGESTDTNLVLERAKAQGAITVGITNEPESALAQMSEHVFLVRAGREKSVAATKTYTGQLLMLYLLAYALGAPIKIDDLRKLADLAAAALKLEPVVRQYAPRYRFMDHAVVVGRGLNYSNAFEFALKMMETCYVVAERFSSADFLHGPIAMVESAFPAFLFTPPGVTWTTMRQMADRLRAAGADVLLVTDRSNAEAAQLGIRTINIGARVGHRGSLPEEIFTPIPYIIPAQLFAEALAGEKGLNPDKPRMLSKVTQTL